jgi:hypothetical protein
MTKAALAVFDDEFKTLNLWEQIAHISGFLGAVPKRGYNAFHKYNYVMESDLVSIVRQYLAAAGIVIIPNVTSVEREGELTSIQCEYTVTNGRESFTFNIPGYGGDRGDKGVYKAMTGSQKYAIMKLFKIETGDDPESDTRVDERAAQPDQASASRPRVTSGSRAGIGRGAHTEKASPVQLRRISELVRELDMERPEFVKLIAKVSGTTVVLPEEEKDQGPALLQVLRDLSTENAGAIVESLAEQIVAADMTAADASGYA